MRGIELAVQWELIELRPGGIELAGAVESLIADPPWSEVAERPAALLAAALGPPGGELSWRPAVPRTPSEAVELARERKPVELVLARAGGSRVA